MFGSVLFLYIPFWFVLYQYLVSLFFFVSIVQHLVGMGLCLISPAARQGTKSRATSLCLRMLNRESYAPKWRMVGEYCKSQRSKWFIILIIKQELWVVYMCCWFPQVRVPSQWSRVPLCPPGMVFSMVRGWEPWAAAIRSCDGTCWACRGHCFPISCILFIFSQLHLVNLVMLPTMP